ncbi:MAG: hypothetical protein CSA09_01020 [Candidatus Contendobacter odensis]|uniref:Sensor domain-containing diguanylate cyclase n=1 Tax=Candidatus Contendibacter odensensis TaxID=1400860 RepID=A0A2G6PFY4_9GAMM|nr:MAG: hypothetical protein CSA09_01020 [Candidatus Contendobacter odensis]
MDAKDGTSHRNPDRFLTKQHVLLVVGYVAAWVLLSWLSTQFDANNHIDLWYPFTGLGFAILLEYGWRALPLPLLASLIAGASINPWDQWPYWLTTHIIELLGYALTAQCLKALIKDHPHGVQFFNNPRRMATFLTATAGCALFIALVCIPLQQAANASFSTIPWLDTVLNQAASHFIGTATITPLLLVCVAPHIRRCLAAEPLRLRSHTLKSIIVLTITYLNIVQTGISILLLAILLWVFSYANQSYLLVSLLLLPVLTWIAATHTIRGAVLATVGCTLCITMLVSATGSQEIEIIAYYQTVMIAVAASGLLTGAISQARLASSARFRDLAEISNQLFWEFDAKGRLKNLHGHFSGHANLSGSELGANWQHYLASEQNDDDLTKLQAAIRRRQPFQQLALQLHLPNQTNPLWTLNNGLPLFHADGKFCGYCGTTRDISTYKKIEHSLQNAETLVQEYDTKMASLVETQVKKRTRQLTAASQHNWRMANFDSLTQLPNRNLFFEHLRKSLQQSQRQRVLTALLMLDLDGFKKVNDTLGHEMGDELLRQIANRLLQCVRSSDLVARLSGDEFTVILRNIENADAAEIVARKIISCIAKPVPLGKTSAVVTASIGIAIYRPEQPASMDLMTDLLRQADAAMYDAKRAGKNDLRFANDKSTTAS